MKKLVLSVAVVLASMSAKAQWTYQNVNNGIDDPYKIAYTETRDNARLKLEVIGGELTFYINGLYFCEDFPTVDVVFTVNGETKKYQVTGAKSDNSNSVFITFDLMNEAFGEDFKNASSVKVRVNETYCGTEVYTFPMTHSKSAVDFMLKP